MKNLMNRRSNLGIIIAAIYLVSVVVFLSNSSYYNYGIAECFMSIMFASAIIIFFDAIDIFKHRDFYKLVRLDNIFVKEYLQLLFINFIIAVAFSLLYAPFVEVELTTDFGLAINNATYKFAIYIILYYAFLKFIVGSLEEKLTLAVGKFIFSCYLIGIMMMPVIYFHNQDQTIAYLLYIFYTAAIRFVMAFVLMKIIDYIYTIKITNYQDYIEEYICYGLNIIVALIIVFNRTHIYFVTFDAFYKSIFSTFGLMVAIYLINFIMEEYVNNELKYSNLFLKFTIIAMIVLNLKLRVILGHDTISQFMIILGDKIIVIILVAFMYLLMKKKEKYVWLRKRNIL